MKMKFWISPLFFFLAAAMLLFGYGVELLNHFVCVIIHEFAHAEMARRCGYRLDTMKLTPYGASLTGAFENARPRDEILIALAGPAVNLVLAVALTAVWWLAPVTYVYTETFVYVNLFTALFNLLPVFPLDGGRVLLAALSCRYKRQSAYRVLRFSGLLAAGVFAVFAFATFYLSANLSLGLIALFFFLSTVFPDKYSQYRRLYSMAYRGEKLNRGIAVKEILVSLNMSLLSLFRLMNANYFYRFTIVDADFKVLGAITELELEQFMAKFGGTADVGAVIKVKNEIRE